VGLHLNELWPQAVLIYRCQGCRHEDAVPVPREILQTDLHIYGRHDFHVSPGRIVNECSAQRMLEIEKLGEITSDEIIDFCEQLNSLHSVPKE